MTGRVAGGQLAVQPHRVAGRDEARRIRPDVPQTDLENAERAHELGEVLVAVRCGQVLIALDGRAAGRDRLVVGTGLPQDGAQVGERTGEIGAVTLGAVGGHVPVQPDGLARHGRCLVERAEFQQARAHGGEGSGEVGARSG